MKTIAIFNRFKLSYLVLVLPGIFTQKLLIVRYYLRERFAEFLGRSSLRKRIPVYVRLYDFFVNVQCSLLSVASGGVHGFHEEKLRIEQSEFLG